MGEVEFLACVLVLLKIGAKASIGINGTKGIVVGDLLYGVVGVYNYTAVPEVVGDVIVIPTSNPPVWEGS